MKKLFLAVAVVGLLAFTGARMVAAHGGYGQGPGFGFCGQYYDSECAATASGTVVGI